MFILTGVSISYLHLPRLRNHPRNVGRKDCKREVVDEYKESVSRTHKCARVTSQQLCVTAHVRPAEAFLDTQVCTRDLTAV